VSIVPARRQENSVTAPSIVLLTEEALTTADAERLARLHTDEEIRYRVLVPADVERNLLVDVLDHLSLFQLREALEAVRGEEEPTRAEAAKALTESLVALTAAGITADGYVVEGDPMTALQKAVSPDVQEVIVITRPHAVEDTFHTDWASKARDLLGVPVLHVYAGSSFLG
jgi:hypothetical protein